MLNSTATLFLDGIINHQVVFFGFQKFKYWEELKSTVVPLAARRMTHDPRALFNQLEGHLN